MGLWAWPWASGSGRLWCTVLISESGNCPSLPFASLPLCHSSGGSVSPLPEVAHTGPTDMGCGASAQWSTAFVHKPLGDPRETNGLLSYREGPSLVTQPWVPSWVSPGLESPHQLPTTFWYNRFPDPFQSCPPLFVLMALSWPSPPHLHK